jgi:hypothetical protein
MPSSACHFFRYATLTIARCSSVSSSATCPVSRHRGGGRRSQRRSQEAQACPDELREAFLLRSSYRGSRVYGSIRYKYGAWFQSRSPSSSWSSFPSLSSLGRPVLASSPAATSFHPPSLPLLPPPMLPLLLPPNSLPKLAKLGRFKTEPNEGEGVRD